MLSTRSPKDVCIVGAARTPLGSFNGSLGSVSAPELGAVAIRGALGKANVHKDLVEQCWMGNVVGAGIGQAPARQAALAAGLPKSTCCTTINKVCSSGMKAIVLGAQQIMLGQADVVVTGGFESMSNIPYYVPSARFGSRMGNATMVGERSSGAWSGPTHQTASADFPSAQAAPQPCRTPARPSHRHSG
jgi:acetyl-CoA C-acetyltransferase